jgi:hypothetical protein
VLARLGSKLFNRLFAKTSNKALEQLFSTVIYAAIILDFYYAWSARAK